LQTAECQGDGFRGDMIVYVKECRRGWPDRRASSS